MASQALMPRGHTAIGMPRSSAAAMQAPFDT
jgi:hypothetical protein